MAQFIYCRCGERIGLEAPLSSWEMTCPGCGERLKIRGSSEPHGDDEMAKELLAPRLPGEGSSRPSEGGSVLDPAPKRTSVSAAENLTLVNLAAPSSERRVPMAPAATKKPERKCPACGKVFDPWNPVCVDCGINIRTGEKLITRDDSRLDEIYLYAERILKTISWIVPFGIYPIASEGHGRRLPITTWLIVAFTTLISGTFFSQLGLGVTGASGWRDVILWAGARQPDAAALRELYQYSNLGNQGAFEAQLEYLIDYEQTHGAPEEEVAPGATTPRIKTSMFGVVVEDSLYAVSDRLILEAHQRLPAEYRCTGSFQWHQLMTYAMLHDELGPFILNVIFLLVFGARVNALVGNFWMIPVYILLVVSAGATHLAAYAGQTLTPMIGADGAVMGLAGMYLVFFPRHPLHFALWLRYWGFRMEPRFILTIFPMRGFWMIGLYVLIQLSAVVLGWSDYPTHFAQLGGFAAGVILALVFVRFRLVHAKGGDIITTMLGPGRNRKRQAAAL